MKIKKYTLTSMVDLGVDTGFRKGGRSMYENVAHLYTCTCTTFLPINEVLGGEILIPGNPLDPPLLDLSKN